LFEASNHLRLTLTKQPLSDTSVKLQEELEQHPSTIQNTKRPEINYSQQQALRQYEKSGKCTPMRDDTTQNDQQANRYTTERQDTACSRSEQPATLNSRRMSTQTHQKPQTDVEQYQHQPECPADQLVYHGSMLRGIKPAKQVITRVGTLGRPTDRLEANRSEW